MIQWILNRLCILSEITKSFPECFYLKTFNDLTHFFLYTVLKKSHYNWRSRTHGVRYEQLGSPPVPSPTPPAHTFCAVTSESFRALPMPLDISQQSVLSYSGKTAFWVSESGRKVPLYCWELLAPPGHTVRTGSDTTPASLARPASDPQKTIPLVRH